MDKNEKTTHSREVNFARCNHLKGDIIIDIRKFREVIKTIPEGVRTRINREEIEDPRHSDL